VAVEAAVVAEAAVVVVEAVAAVAAELRQLALALVPVQAAAGGSVA
jgi:hypothetical protein